MQASSEAPRTVDTPAARELARMCVQAHYDALHAPASRAGLCQLVHRVLAGLPEDDALRGSIPFYWHVDGPHSPPLLGMADRMVSDGELAEDGRGLAAAAGTRGRGAGLEAAGRSLKNAVSELARAGPRGMQYLEYAPSRLYRLYRGAFLPMLRSYLYGGEPGIGTDLDLAMSGIYGNIPDDPMFRRFSYPYEDRRRILARLLGGELTDAARGQIYEASEGVFRTIADGMRVLYHDGYFEPEVPRWRAEFEDSRARMERETDALHDLASGLGMADTGRMAFPDVVEWVLRERSRGRLEGVSFMPTKLIRELDNGHMSTETFCDMSDEEFRAAMYRFDHAYNATVTLGTGEKWPGGGTYRITGSAQYLMEGLDRSRASTRTGQDPTRAF